MTSAKERRSARRGRMLAILWVRRRPESSGMLSTISVSIDGHLTLLHWHALGQDVEINTINAPQGSHMVNSAQRKLTAAILGGARKCPAASAASCGLIAVASCSGLLTALKGELHAAENAVTVTREIGSQ
jgi:hypothetical protein